MLERYTVMVLDNLCQIFPSLPSVLALSPSPTPDLHLSPQQWTPPTESPGFTAAHPNAASFYTNKPLPGSQPEAQRPVPRRPVLSELLGGCTTLRQAVVVV